MRVRPAPARRRALAAALLALLSLAAAPAAAHAATYVDVAGRGGACSDVRSAAQAASPATPWCSLTAAAAKAPSAGTVLVRGGSYPYTQIDGSDRTPNAATITLKPYPGETPVVFAVDVRDATHLRFEGLRFSGTMSLVYFGNDHIAFVGNDLTNAVNVRGSRDIHFEGNHFHDGPDSCTVDSSEAGGVRAMTGTQGLTIRGNHFERLTGDAIQMDGTSVLIEGNTFDHIQVRPGCSAHTDVIQSLGAEDVTIRGNVARDNDSGILNSSADHQTSGWTIENNVFARSSGTPLQLDNQLDDLVVTNNTFAASGVGVLFRWWTNPGVPVNSQGFVIADNVFDDGYSVDPRLRIAVADYNVVPAGAHRYGAHDLAADPRFVDAATDRFDLRADSPAVDSGASGLIATIRGIAYHLPATDLLGGTRTGAHDRGAYERGATPAGPAPPASDTPDADPAPDPAPAPSDPAEPSEPAEEPAEPSGPAEPGREHHRPERPALPTAPRLIGVSVPRVVRPVPAARLRAALKACTARRSSAARARCRSAAAARLAPAVRFGLDRDATVTVTVSAAAGRGRELGRTTVSARKGANAVALTARRGLRPGRYAVRIAAVAGGQTAATTQTVVVRRG
jgi:Right handed beta helix region